jgi:nicotinamidase-related amidase
MVKTTKKLNLDPRKAALLIIDVQQALFSRPTPIHNAEHLLDNINSLIDRWQQVDGLVVYIQHSNNKMLVKDTPEWEFHPNLKRVNSGELIHKLYGNAFEKTNLKGLLNSNGVNEVVITGLVTQGCVRATCTGANNLGYRVILVEDGHSNYRKDAEKIIVDWNQKLTEDTVELLSTDGILLQR